MISFKQAFPTSQPSFTIFPNVKNGEKVLSLCKNPQFRPKYMAANSKGVMINSVPLFGNAFELLLRLPLKRYRKRKDLVCRVSDLKNELKLIGDQDVGLRREIAIKRVLEDNDGRCIRDYFLFQTSRGEELFIQSWTPVSNKKIKGLVIILHGLNEHSGRYNDFAKQLNANGYKVYGMDWCGHGGSDGLHAYVPSLDAAVVDMKAFVEKVSADNSSLPCFCFGHSTGGAIILKVLMDPAIKALMKGAVLTSPAVGVKPSHPILWVIAPIFSMLLPKYQFRSAMKKGLPVSRDPEALIAKYSDPLVYKGAIRVRTGSEILRLSSFLQQNLSKLTVPFLVLHGTSDTVTDPTASQMLHDEASSTDKSIKLYNGYLHDLLFEPEKEMIEKDIIAWLNSR